MAQSPLFSRKQPGGVFTIVDIQDHAGDVWFVDSGHASATNAVSAGRNPDIPFATLDYAIGQCTASNGDVIYVMPGHTESITTAAGIAADVAGISIIGLGNGNNRPVITIASTDNAGTMTVSADNVKISNLVLVCNDDGLTNALVVTGDNCDIDIEFQDTSSTVEAATAVRLDTANNCNLRLKYLGFTGGNAAVSAVRLDDCDNVRIYIDAYGVVSTAWVEMVDVASTNVSVRGQMYTQGITNFTRDVVDTVTGSTWDAVIFDASAGATISGGSAAALATDDITALATAISTIDEYHDVPAADNVLNAQMNEVIGNKADAVAAGDVTSTDTLVAYIKQIVTELSGTAGIPTWPAAAAPANAVSFAEAVRDIWDALRNGTGGGEPETNRSIADYLGVTPAFFVPGLGYRVTKTEDVNTAASDDLFTVTGKVLVTALFGEVTNVIGAQPVDYILRIKTDNVNLCASTDISAAAIGVLYSLSGQSTDTLETNAEGVKTADTGGKGLANRVVGLAGGSCTIESVRTAGDAGDAIIWTLFYLPLEAGAAVAAAA